MKTEQAYGAVAWNTSTKSGKSPDHNDPPSFSASLEGLLKVESPSIKDEGEPDPNAWITEKEKKAHEAVLDTFSRISTMKPEELIRAKYLEAHHLTEDEVSKLPPDQRAQIEQEIEDEIDRQMEAEIRRKHDEELQKAQSACGLGSADTLVAAGQD